MSAIKTNEMRQVSSGAVTDFSTRAQQVELATLIERFTDQDGMFPTAIAALFLIRFSNPTETLHGILQPACCIAAQGSKQIMLAGDIYSYDPTQHVVVSIDLPLAARVVQASPKAPYLGLRLDLNAGEIGLLIAEADLAIPKDHESGRGIYVSRSSWSLFDAVIRLVRLLHCPQDIPILAPLIQREILYRLLAGEQSAQLLQIAIADSQAQRIANAIQWLKQNYAQPLRIEAVARAVNMSPSGLHHWFKAVTGMSPLRYQKQLRLQEARRLMMSEVVDAATAGYRVGYESPSQFGREYRRLFGAPPARDIARLCNASGSHAQSDHTGRRIPPSIRSVSAHS